MKSLVCVSVGLLVTLLASAALAEDAKRAPRPVVCALEHFSEAETKTGERVGFCAPPGKRRTLFTAWSAPVKAGGASYVVGVR